jgi:hypothetical protein
MLLKPGVEIADAIHDPSPEFSESRSTADAAELVEMRLR